MAKPYGRIYNNNKNVSITPLDIKDLYPVGSIYLSINNTNPSTYFGGTWEKLSGGYLYGCVNSISNSSYTGSGTQSKASFTSGSTTLTIDQIPSHNHPMLANKNAGGQNAGIEHTWGTAYSGYDNNSCGYTGGGQGHTHTIPAHSHNVAYIGVFVWKRTA